MNFPAPEPAIKMLKTTENWLLETHENHCTKLCIKVWIYIKNP